jgi:predicted RNA polymerase sigma factor
MPYAQATILSRNGRSDEARDAARRALAIQRDFQPASDLLQRLP